MNHLYRQLKLALARRDRPALSRLVKAHPEAHDGCELRPSPVEMIAESGPDMLEVAFRAGLSPDSGPVGAQTFLQQVAAGGDSAAVTLCIKYGADLDRRNESGETALGYACSWGHLEVVKLLVEAGAAVNAVEHDLEDGFSNTALDCCSRYPDIEAFLRSHGAKRFSEMQGGG